MRYRNALILLAAVALFPLQAFSQGLDTPDKPKKKGGKRVKNKIAFTGEITELEESSFRLRPWDPKLPRRLVVTVAPNVRYLKQEEGGRDELKPGDVVMIVEDPRPIARVPRKAQETKEEGEAREAKLKELQKELDAKNGRARCVMRLWPAKNGAVDPDDDTTARVLLEGARGYFSSPNEGGVNAPNDRTPRTLGILKSLKPLTIQVEGADKSFDTYGETVWVNHKEMKPADLRKGKTVVVRTPTAPGADGTLQALMIAQCPEPNRSPNVQRKLILRERRADK